MVSDTDILYLVLGAIAVAIGLGLYFKKRGARQLEANNELPAAEERPTVELSRGRAAEERVTVKLEGVQIPAPDNKTTIKLPAGIRISPPADTSLWRSALEKTRSLFGAGIRSVWSSGERRVLHEVSEALEEQLLAADLGAKTSAKIIKSLLDDPALQSETQAERVQERLKAHLLSIFSGKTEFALGANKPVVILVVGVNGSGKTTSIGKLAQHFSNQGKKVLLAAGDTFRAAAVEQLEAWGRRVSSDVQKGSEQADPAAVVFDAIKRGHAEGYDVVIADTAGRLHTQAPLMDELRKVSKAAERAHDAPIEHTLLVIDATMGQNAMMQAEQFLQTAAVSGLILTKMDGSAKGGVAIAIADHFNLPIYFVGIGEKADAIIPFDPKAFVDALFV